MAATEDESTLNHTADADEIELLTKEPAAEPGDPPEKKPAAEPAPPSEPSNEDHDEDEVDADATAKRDTELEAAADDAEREAIRARRREERKNRKERSREKMDGLERQVRALAEQNQRLTQQVGSIQNSNHGTQLAALDQHITQAEQAVQHFKSVIADAGTKGDGATIADATEAMIVARERAGQLKALKERVTKTSAAPAPLNPVMVEHVKSFLGKHKWYGGPQSSDMDSRMMKIIDDSVAADGFDSTTPAYYEELEKRGRERLPHRFGAASAPPPAPPAGPRRQPVAGSGGEGGGKPGGGADFTLSAERVKAMKESGAWDDPKRREQLIRSYRDFDKQNAGRN
jgi:hypothetical protein